jgi:hypothetical protein
MSTTTLPLFPAPVPAPKSPTNISTRNTRTPSATPVVSSLCDASARVGSASFVVAALSGIIDHLGDTAGAKLSAALWTASAAACEELSSARAVLQTLRSEPRHDGPAQSRRPRSNASTRTSR